MRVAELVAMLRRLSAETDVFWRPTLTFHADRATELDVPSVDIRRTDIVQEHTLTLPSGKLLV